MRIAYFTDVFLPTTNGVVTCVKTLSTMMASRGHEIIIFTPKPEADKTVESSVPHVTVEALPSVPSFFYPDIRFALPFSPAVMKRVKDFNTDIIHAHTPGIVGWTGALVAKLLKIPFVATFHTYFMEPEYLSVVGFDKLRLENTNVLQKLGWSYSNMFYSQAQLVTSPSEFTKDDLLEHGLSHPIKVISNGIDLELLKKMSTDSVSLVSQFKLPPDYFLYVGRVSREKSLDVLIKAFQLFSQGNKKNDLVIVGDGPARQELEELVETLSLKKRVHFLGMISHETLIRSDIFKQALSFVTTSKSEIQPVSILEAMAFGLPIIGVTSRGVTELIQGNGIGCEPDNIQTFANALELMSADTKIRKNYAKKSVEIISKHDIHSSILQMEKEYRSLIKS